MASRTELQSLLEAIPDVTKVYFQQPPKTQMVYPCILYSLDSAKTDFADNNPYAYKKAYLITVVDENPDSEIPDLVAALPSCVFDRFYTADNLNHFVFKSFF